MQSTYNDAIKQVFQDEGGYTNDPHDPGGPTNWGITLEDARHYWKPDATALDVRQMPKSVAADIYEKHYAAPIDYDSLPAGVDYTVLDYAINSGISRAVKTLQEVVGVPADGSIGPVTLAATNKSNPDKVIDAIYDSRLSFLRRLPTWSRFGKGWNYRCVNGRTLAHFLVNDHAGSVKAPEPPITQVTQVKTQNWLAIVLNFILSFIKGK